MSFASSSHENVYPDREYISINDVAKDVVSVWAMQWIHLDNVSVNQKAYLKGSLQGKVPLRFNMV